MYERFLEQFPTLLFFTAFAVLHGLLLVVGRSHSDTNSIWDLRRTIRRGETRGKFTFLFLTLPGAAITEELAFRGALLVLFTGLTLYSWIGILASSVLFSLLHWNDHGYGMHVITHPEYKPETDDWKIELKRIRTENPEGVRKARLAKLRFTFVMGILFSCIALYFRSLWLATLIHYLWNLLAFTGLLPRLSFFYSLPFAIRNIRKKQKRPASSVRLW